MEILDRHFYLMKVKKKSLWFKLGLDCVGAVPVKWGRKVYFQVLLTAAELAHPEEASCSS